MAKRTHYQVLGVDPKSDVTVIRTAYRQLVLKYHPDRSKDPQATARFMEVTEAFEVLRDPKLRAAYDETLKPKPKATQPAPAPIHRQAEPKKTAPPVSAELPRLATLYGRGRFKDAEALANLILTKDPRQPMPYAVLGDLARARGDLQRAAHMYALASQMDPNNETYIRKHEEVTMAVASSAESPAEPGHKMAAATVGFGLVACSGAYLALSKEPPLWPQMSLISTWTLGLIVMLFLSGISVGAALSVSRIIDRFSGPAGATGPVTPTVALGTLAIFSFWAAALVYVVLGLAQDAFSISTSRMMLAIGGVLILLAAASGLSGHLDPSQVLLWGGNLAYLGALCGWMVTDSLRR